MLGGARGHSRQMHEKRVHRVAVVLQQEPAAVEVLQHAVARHGRMNCANVPTRRDHELPPSSQLSEHRVYAVSTDEEGRLVRNMQRCISLPPRDPRSD